MKRTLPLLLLFFSVNVFSQKPIIIKLVSHFLEGKVPPVDFYVEDVIDNRLYKEYLGIAQLGSYNLKVPIKFENPLKDEMEAFFKELFPFDESKTPITIRVNELFIKEDTKILTEIGTINLQFDILKRKEGQVYILLDSYSFDKRKRTLDATYGNVGRLAGVLLEAILAMNNEMDVNKSGTPIDLSYNLEPPVLYEKPNVGFYYTYPELANNLVQADFKIDIKEKSKNKGSNLIKITDSLGVSNENFAYFDGENYFLNTSFYSTSQYFIKTFRIDNFLLFTEDFIADNYIDGFTIARGKSSYAYVKSRRPIIFNLADGKFYTLRRDNMAQLLENKYPDLFKNFKKNEKKDIQEIYKILDFLFKNEDAERVRGILTS